MSKFKKYIPLIILSFLLIFSIFAFMQTAKVQEEAKLITPQEEILDATMIDISREVLDETQPIQGEISFRDIKIYSAGATNVVTGFIKNNGTRSVNVETELKLFESTNNHMLGTTKEKIYNLAANKEIEFKLSILGDYTTVDRFTIESKVD